MFYLLMSIISSVEKSSIFSALTVLAVNIEWLNSLSENEQRQESPVPTPAPVLHNYLEQRRK
jgi:hypothetical protein